MKKTFEERFLSKILIASNGCHYWTAAKCGGYGVIREAGRGSKLLYVHIVSWEKKNGLIPEGLYVLHRCDNPSCVNTEHLFLGTKKENTEDMWRKRRRILLHPYSRAREYPSFSKL